MHGGRVTDLAGGAHLGVLSWVRTDAALPGDAMVGYSPATSKPSGAVSAWPLRVGGITIERDTDAGVEGWDPGCPSVKRGAGMHVWWAGAIGVGREQHGTQGRGRRGLEAVHLTGAALPLRAWPLHRQQGVFELFARQTSPCEAPYCMRCCAHCPTHLMVVSDVDLEPYVRGSPGTMWVCRAAARGKRNEAGACSHGSASASQALRHAGKGDVIGTQRGPQAAGGEHVELLTCQPRTAFRMGCGERRR